MEGSTQKNEELEQKKDRFRQDLVEEEYRQSSSSSDFSTSEATGNGQEEAQSHSSFDESSSSHCTNSDASDLGKKPYSNDRKLLLENHGSYVSDMMMRDRFAKLLLGEDMSGCGNGVSSALAISNAITNVCATLFGQLWRLEPLPAEQKSMWRREMELLLCVSDHIVELIPSWQTFSDGTKLEVMACRPRSDLCISLPALRKLDNMLMEILDSFENTDFWYVDQGIPAPKADGSSTFRRPPLRQEEKWWLPVPQVSPRGLLDDSRKQLQHKRDCASQILKAAMTINNTTLEEMDIPQAYFENLPRNGRAILGDIIYRYITSEQFTPECLLDCLDISSEHRALETANRVEASISIWRRGTNTGRSIPKSSWEMVKELMFDGDRRETLAGRAQRLLLCLKQRFPGLPQTALETSKIQCNKDVGKSILESYSRVLESLAFTITARIDDVFYVDDLAKCSNQFSSAPEVGAFAPKSVSTPCSVPFLSTPYRTAFTSPNFSPAKVEGAPYVSSSQLVKTGLNSFSIPSPELGASMAVAGSYYHGTGDDVCRAIQESVVSDEP